MLNTDLAALAHLGERQTEVHFESRIHCDFWRYCVRSTEAAFLLSFLQVSSNIGLLLVFTFVNETIYSPLWLPFELLAWRTRKDKVESAQIYFSLLRY